MEYNVGDIVRTKKAHPCGSKLWEITRVGVDFKLKCQGCGHVVVLEFKKYKFLPVFFLNFFHNKMSGTNLRKKRLKGIDPKLRFLLYSKPHHYKSFFQKRMEE